jgi:hypothetical protein
MDDDAIVSTGGQDGRIWRMRRAFGIADLAMSQLVLTWKKLRRPRRSGQKS